MKQTILFFVYMSVCCLAMKAQTTDDAQRIAIHAVVPDGGHPEAAANLETKLTRMLIANGFADNGYTDRFVLTAKIDVLSKDIAPTTPARVSQKLEVTLMVGDVVENRIYESHTLSLSGIGTTETKALIAAFQRINPQNKELQAMLERAKAKIVSFYTDNCDRIVLRANTLAGTGQYDEAIFGLISVPDVCADCFRRCQEEAVTIYRRKIDSEGATLLAQANNEWMKAPNAAGAVRVAALISGIDPHSSAYPQVTALRQTITEKLQADEKQEWEFQMRKYEDSQIFKRSIVEAVKAIGVAWGNGQPQSVTKTIVRGWW